MRRNKRQSIAFVLMGMISGLTALAQDADVGGRSASNAGGGSGGSGTGGTSTPADAGSASSGSSSSTGSSGGTGAGFTGSSSSFSLFGGGSAGNPAAATPSRPAETPPSFTVPGFYGQGSTNFVGGTGRLARAKFETKFTFGIGYDDNLNQAPRDTPGITPARVIQTGQREILVPVAGDPQFAGGGFGGTTVPTVTYRRELIPITQEIPATLPLERESSFYTRAGLSLELQSYSRRSLFVANADLSHSYYFDRSDPQESNGSLALTYLYRFSPRLQATVQANAAYLTQPDLSRANTPQRETQGDLVTGLGRIDLAYRFSPRFTLTLSGNYQGNRYTKDIEQVGDFDQVTVGVEAKYLWSPRWSAVAEIRHGVVTYLNRTDLDSSTDYFLIGTEFTLNPRLSGTFRLGEAIKQFDVGNTQSAPYVESSLTYRSTARSSVQWTNRFGFEEAQSPTEERLVYRSTISYNYVFTPKLRGSVIANLIHELDSNSATDLDLIQDTADATIALEYQWSRHFSLNASYTFTLVNSNQEFSDYYRNRLFLGGQYMF